ncbi:ATPase subunit of ABC transporter with duplicated ATPase domains [Paenibacillus phyllosphaerae]|uniref:ATPase subunit of ABC transporter with duplicated ATPase domains n=1 Tax=Paenibacillus phyllosphaerae TaxID=274593 RepID=A0A7W5AYB9_9BACL|nr:ABC-F family ATP-binding cassette domain-containing protein [Paenibacillus phyllosphaerae]MBB3110739.1 ATPase subunit of ABC transporter with duplicated ATPase domains [Paenibacillus phyllosphaerae]
MIIINSQQVKKYHGAQLVLENATFEIHEGERVGLVGRNGSGKSTLLRLIAKSEKQDEGQLTVRKEMKIGYLAQIPDEWERITVYEALASGFRAVMADKAQMTQLELRMAEPATVADGDLLESLLGQYASLQERFERAGGYELDARIDQVTTGLGISRAYYDRSFATLSGGEKTKVGLAALLVQSPELLLLDEPTNHLDMACVEWLEQFLNVYAGACLIVSHDRTFLDRVVTKIIDLEDGETSVYHANYTGYVKEKEERLLRQFAEFQEQQKQMKKMKETIRQLEEWGRVGGNEKFFRRAQSMQKALDRMEKLKRPVMDRRHAEFGIQQADRSGKRVLHFEAVNKAYGEKQVLRQADGLLEYGERIMLLGPNGAGKSTLVKLMLGQEQPDSGKLELGARVDVGYLAQEEHRADERQTVLGYYREQAGMEEGEARSRLARYLFYGADVFKQVGQLSGGEWTRLRLALLVLKKPNLLILDEPTNHMDIASREALEEALEEYPGTLLAITHDRYFINRLAEKIWELEQGRITVYHGDYDHYVALRKQQGSVEQPDLSSGRGAGRTTASSAAANHSDEERAAERMAAKATKSEQGRRERLEKNIAEAEAQLLVLDEQLAIAGGTSDAGELARLWTAREVAQQQLDRLFEQWMELEEPALE